MPPHDLGYTDPEHSRHGRDLGPSTTLVSQASTYVDESAFVTLLSVPSINA
jgi:hypothetical protein